MSEERNNFQIVRKDAKNCFVESLCDAFEIGKIHLAFATYDLNRPAGQRQTNNIHIYIAADEFLNLCRKLNSGELSYLIKQRKSCKDASPIYESMGGTSAEKLAKQGRSRPDCKSISRIVKIVAASKYDLLFVADSGPGETTEKGLIVPKFGNKPENHVAVSMNFDALSELLLLTQAHYQAWLTSSYMRKPMQSRTEASQPQNNQNTTPIGVDTPMF